MIKPGYWKGCSSVKDRRGFSTIIDDYFFKDAQQDTPGRGDSAKVRKNFAPRGRLPDPCHLRGHQLCHSQNTQPLERGLTFSYRKGKREMLRSPERTLEIRTPREGGRARKEAEPERRAMVPPAMNPHTPRPVRTGRQDRSLLTRSRSQRRRRRGLLVQSHRRGTAE